jgi:hypothetical protein
MRIGIKLRAAKQDAATTIVSYQTDEPERKPTRCGCAWGLVGAPTVVSSRDVPHETR